MELFSLEYTWRYCTKLSSGNCVLSFILQQQQSWASPALCVSMKREKKKTRLLENKHAALLKEKFGDIFNLIFKA